MSKSKSRSGSRKKHYKKHSGTKHKKSGSINAVKSFARKVKRMLIKTFSSISKKSSGRKRSKRSKSRSRSRSRSRSKSKSKHSKKKSRGKKNKKGKYE